MNIGSNNYASPIEYISTIDMTPKVQANQKPVFQN